MVQDALGPAGWTAAFVGLLGLHPRLGDRSRWLSGAGVTFAALGLVGATVSTVANLVALLGVAGDLPTWIEALQILIMVGIVPGFLAFASATFRTDGPSRRVGVLLLAPAVLFAVNVARVAVLGSTTPVWAPFVLGSGQALALLGIGYSLEAGVTPMHDPESELEPTAR